jgi:uncharacterized protein involved in exopolysaccharide biosynthesis
MSTTAKPDPNRPGSHSDFMRITRRWRLILLLWLIITAPIIYAIYVFEKPRFEAFSLLRVATDSASLFETSKPPEQVDPKNVAPYMQTQIGLITSDRVLGAAVASPEVSGLSAITRASDPNVELRSRMTVAIVPDSYLIRVALALPDENQAAIILNAVVRSFMQLHGEHQRSGNSTLRKNLADQLEKYKNQIEEKRAELRKIMQRGGVNLDPGYRASDTLTQEQSGRLAEEMLNTELELIKAESTLEATEAAAGVEKEPRMRQTLSDLRINVAALVKRKQRLAKYFDGLKVERKVETDDTFEAAFVSRQLEILLREHTQVGAHLKQLEFDSQQGDFQVTLVDTAVPPRTPMNSRRIAYIAIAPVVVLLALMSFALCVPLRGSRACGEE